MTAIEAGREEELDQLEREVLGTGGADASKAADGMMGAAEGLAEGMMADPKKILELTEDEIASVAQLLFGFVADARAPALGEDRAKVIWELPARPAMRLAKWAKLAMDRHGGIPDWLVRYLPDFMAVALLGHEIVRRVQLDKAARAGRTQGELELGDGVDNHNGGDA